MAELISCLIVDDEPVACDVLKGLLAKVDGIRIVACCRSALEAFKWLNKGAIDLIFLDINMPEISGLAFAKTINREVKIIFTTAYREYAVDGFDLRAVDYLLKPISFQRLLQSIHKYLDENTPVVSGGAEEIVVEKSDFFFVRADRKMVKIDFADIRFVESLSDYIKIHLVNGSVVTRETISNIEAKLPHKQFLRVHRSFIVAIARIDSFTNEYIEMASQEIPISRSYKSEVLVRLEGINDGF